ncbi:MAG: hypothetical protein NTZ93_02430 [Candidatus Beckwithbacteria bacterium]|nr:hypothetical protein [Candidatus Beckwithbacteria bacterium]
MNDYFIKTTQPQTDLKRINDYLLTFVGEIQVKTNTAAGASIFYSGLKTPSTLTLKPNQIRLVCSPEDNLSVTFIRNIGLRIYNPLLKAFIPNDPNILEVNQTNPIFKQYHLTPIFRYNHSLVFFCRDKSNKIHLVNRHLLEDLTNHPQPKLFPREFSIIVAEDIGCFVALFDRGLIPINFHQFLYGRSKIINLSGFNLEKLPPHLSMNTIYFQLDHKNQSFTQTEMPHLPQTINFKKIPSNCLAIKVAQDIGYQYKGKSPIPILSVSVFQEL